MTLVDATYTAFIVPLGIAFHFKAIHFSWYNAIDIAAGKYYPSRPPALLGLMMQAVLPGSSVM